MSGRIVTLCGEARTGNPNCGDAKVSKRNRCLFVDDYHVSEIKGLTRNLHAVEKHPANPVIRPDRPWEGDGVAAGNSSLYDPCEKLFKIWYLAAGRICYATSTDGLHWEKPDLGLVEYEGSAKNNIVNGSGCQIVHGDDDFGPVPPEQKFRTVGWSHEKGQLVQTSPDGLNWADGPSLELVGVGDVFVCGKTTRPLSGDDPRGLPGYPCREGMSRYLASCRWCMPVGRFDGSSDIRPTRRVLALFRSDDFRYWYDPIRILTPDDLDDEMAHERIEAALADGSLKHDCKEDRRCEFYTMYIVPYEDIYLGLMLVFDAAYEFHRVDKNNQAGPSHVQLVASRDLVNWQRLGDRKPFIGRGAEGEFDWALAVYSCMPIVKDGKLWFFYDGCCTTHAGSRDEAYLKELLSRIKAGELPALGSVGLATLRRDGFVSLDGGRDPGYVLTKAFDWPASGKLRVNVDASGGEVRICVCQPDGTPYPGYEQSEPLTGDLLGAEVEFAGQRGEQPKELHGHGTKEETGVVDSDDYSTLKGGRKARLKITARNASLYSYWFE